MILGIDTAARLDAETAKAIKAGGYAFAGRYLVPATMWKALTRAEAEAITAAGLRILTVWETTADRVKGGAAAGAADGAMALKCAHDIGMPSSGAIYFAVDYDAGASDFDTIEAYLKAARQNTEEYDTGVYGSCRLVEAMAQRKACTYFWQCVAWSQGQKSKYRNVYQAQFGKTAGGVSVDIDECADMDAAGIWNYGEDNMTGEEIYNKLSDYLSSQPAPDWARSELEQAVAMGITDGTRPMELIPRYQAAIMAKRALERARG